MQYNFLVMDNNKIMDTENKILIVLKKIIR